jgi:hypothetical protein
MCAERTRARENKVVNTQQLYGVKMCDKFIQQQQVGGERGK